MKTLKQNWGMWLIALILIAYGIGVLVVYRNGIFDKVIIVENVFTVIGWIVVLIVGFIHLGKSRKDAVESRRDEVRKSFEISAFKEINESVQGLARVISSVTTFCSWVPSQWELHLLHSYVTFNAVEIQQRLDTEVISVYEAQAKFIGSIESNEMAVLEYDHYRKYLYLRIQEWIGMIDAFKKYLSQPLVEDIIKKDPTAFNNVAKAVSENGVNIQSYLFDYRVELMNEFLKDVFGREVPQRCPLDKKYKTLRELAVKKNIEQEWGRVVNGLFNAPKF